MTVTDRKQPTSYSAGSEPRDVTLAPPGYQPTKAELEEEIDMPGLSREEIARVLGPVRVKRRKR